MDVKRARFKTSELKNQIKKQDWDNHYVSEHSVHSVSVCILLNFMAAMGYVICTGK
jgi:hypothetical protein